MQKPRKPAQSKPSSRKSGSAYRRFSIRLATEQWNRLALISERLHISLRSIMDLAIEGVPEEPELFKEFMCRRPSFRRRRGVIKPSRAVSMSPENLAKLYKLAGFQLVKLDPKGRAKLNKYERKLAFKFYYSLRFEPGEILRAALEEYLHFTWREGSKPRSALADFCNKPLRIATFPLELRGGKGRFKLPPNTNQQAGGQSLRVLEANQPVLIDHSILLLATVQVADRHPRDNHTPCSQECEELLRSAPARKVLIHQLHQSLYLLELERLVKGREHLPFEAGKVSPMVLLTAKAQQLAGLALEVLPLRYSETRLPPGSGDFMVRLAIATAKEMLGTEDFVFASACPTQDQVDGVWVVRPGDLGLPTTTYKTKLAASTSIGSFEPEIFS